MDIYRGDSSALAPIVARSPSPTASMQSSSSTSFIGGGRLGALTSVLESAISRWAKARGRSSSSSTTSSSSSSSSSHRSTATNSRSRIRLRKRRSTATFDSSQSEIDFTARINRLKAREESRQIPRSLILYLPPSLNSPLSRPADHEGEGVVRSTSLPSILNQLDSALRGTAKSRKNHPRCPAAENEMLSSIMSKDYASSSKAGKRAVRRRYRRHSAPAVQLLRSFKPHAWFLDVASPTWEDMHEIGKFLHLHPLTLEDVLQRDPREKLEVFPNLGYYFISFRAIEDRQTRDRRWARESREFVNCPLDDGGVVAEANVYLVVFENGICAFHFADTTEHMDYVRNRIKSLQDTINVTSDRIAHGILDSIVDSFFPFLKEVENEVIAIEDVVLANNGPLLPSTVAPPTPTFLAHRRSSLLGMDEKRGSLQLSEKVPTIQSVNYAQTRFSLPPLTFSLLLRRFRRVVSRRWRKLAPISSDGPVNDVRMTLVRRMARTRRLVTSLGRSLGTKSEVVAQIRKRLIAASTSKLEGASSPNEDADLAIYLSDVQDHILTLQVSLNHYERVLSRSHPTYLSQLHSTTVTYNNQMDLALLRLTTIVIGISCTQVLTGLCSMNVQVPQNATSSGGSFHIFGFVICLTVAITLFYMCLVRYWWIQAKKLYRKVL